MEPLTYADMRVERAQGGGLGGLAGATFVLPFRGAAGR